MRAPLRTFLGIGAAWCCIAGLAPAAASAFGTVNILGQRGEHERITRLALGCRPGQPHDGSCFESASLSNVAGTTATFGAVGAPDNIPLRLTGGPFYWHCDEADYLDVPGYPQSRAKATEILNGCRDWARDMLLNGRPDHVPGRSWPVQGAVAEARTLLNGSGNVDVSDPGTGFFSPSCTFDGTHRSREVQRLGAVRLRAARDRGLLFTQQLGRSLQPQRADQRHEPARARPPRPSRLLGSAQGL